MRSIGVQVFRPQPFGTGFCLDRYQTFYEIAAIEPSCDCLPSCADYNTDRQDLGNPHQVFQGFMLMAPRPITDAFVGL
ncbi:hypothetical protein D3C78_487070 [compost metagenome]